MSTLFERFILVKAEAYLSPRLGGKNLICYSIEFALNLFSKENIWINTNCEKTIEIAQNYGVNFIQRPENLCRDETTTFEVLQHQQDFFEKRNVSLDAYILLQPTNPFRKKEELMNAISLYQRLEYKSVFSCSKILKKVGAVENNLFHPLNYKYGMRSQDMNHTLMYENGSFYIFSPSILSEKKIITEKSYPFECNSVGATIDIDDYYDLHIAESFLKWKQNENYNY